VLNDLIFRVRALFRRRAAEAELEDELSFHREHQLQKYAASGLTEAEALRLTRMNFGGLDQVKEECRDARGVRVMETLFQDVRFGLRTLRKSPAFTLVALLTLALGIGANTAIFSVLYGVLLRPLPYQDAGRLIVLNETTPRVGMVSVSYPNFLDWRAQSRAFPQMAAVHSIGFNLSGVNQPESIGGQAVSPNFLPMLGVHPFIGRGFDASEEKPGTAPVVLISYSLWQSHFGGDPRAVGRVVNLDGRGFTIVGVLPPDFRWIEKTDVLEPVGVLATNNSAFNERGDRGDSVVLGRLAPRIGFLQAQAEMETIAARLEKAYPGSNDQFGVLLRPIRDVFVSELRPAVLVLFAAVMFVLLIACANVANLFLMRGAGRTREMALRIAIGATRGRIVAQMLAESFILTSLGGLLGLGLAVAAIHAFAGLLGPDMLVGASVDLNGPALLFTAGVVALAAFVFGLIPAMHATKANVQSELKEGGRTTSAGSGASRWRGALVIAEVSLALILLVGAGLMMKSLYRLLSVDAGIRTEHVVTMQMSLRSAQYDKNPAILNFWDQLLGRVHALPGIQSAALGTGVPLTDDHSRTDITIEGMALPKPGSYPHPDVHVVSPGYVATLGIRLLRGREFTEMDNETAPRVALINARVAQRYFAAHDPVGQRFMFDHPSSTRAPQWLTVVGVVGDTKLYGLANPSRLEVYVPMRQSVSGSMTLIVKSAGDPAALVSGIRGAVAAVDKDQPVVAIATMKQLVRNSVSTRRITFIVLGAFSALALVLAAIGIYGVISYSVAQRTQEIGIRIALGARSGDVLGMVIAQGAKMAGAGILIGLAASFALTRLMTKLLFSVSSADPATFAAVTVVLAVIAVLASYIPARRTLRVDPMSALRCE
jgi:putative ABC transport system permease protein